jgi:hypothetical protein
MPTNVRATNGKDELGKDLYGSGPIWIDFPDVEAITRERLDKWNAIYDLTLLEPALREQLAAVPPRCSARIYACWSYMEGVWAEALLRKNKEAEEAALLAGAFLVEHAMP